jgi:hypothetical protein
MSTADHVTCCCADTLAEVARLTAERDRARALAIRLEAEAAQPYLPASLCEGWNVRDLADELLTLQPVDPARCNPRRKAHPVIGGRELECGECWRVRVVERLEQWRRSVEGQEGAESAPSRAADGLEGLDWHSRTPATGEARKSAESDAGLSADSAPDPTPIIEWLASVGLDAQRIPAREPRLVRRDGGAWFLRFYEFALDADGRRILDGDGFAHTPTREVEVATLPPEPWLSDWVAPLDDLDDDAEWEARTAGRSRAASPPATTAL